MDEILVSEVDRSDRSVSLVEDDDVARAGWIGCRRMVVAEAAAAVVATVERKDLRDDDDSCW